MTMKCTHDQDLLILLQADELSETEAASVRRQVESCEACREELDRLSHVASAVVPPAVDPDAVARARALAYTRIGSSWRVRSRVMSGRIADVLRRVRPMPELALGMLLVAVGYGIGSRGDTAPPPVAESQMVDVWDIEWDENLGQAVVRYDRPGTRSLSGDLSNREVAYLLQSALLEGDDNGIRNRALKTVQALASSGAPADDLSRAITELVRSEPQEALRLRAIWAMDALYESTELPEDARDALLVALTSDAGDGVRIAALNTLMAHQTFPDDARTLRQVMSSDNNPYVRSGAAETLQRMGIPLEELR
ncbi:MAG: hypothetical protein HKN29_15310 [Rhodothermales bacterium]|nr:hypothetical protein [Rhodothermales bacterium]